MSSLIELIVSGVGSWDAPIWRELHDHVGLEYKLLLLLLLHSHSILMRDGPLERGGRQAKRQVDAEGGRQMNVFVRFYTLIDDRIQVTTHTQHKGVTGWRTHSAQATAQAGAREPPPAGVF